MKDTILFPVLAALLLVSACGIKPSEVDPPQGHKADTFPHIYPNPDTEKNK